MLQEWYWALSASVLDQAKPLGYARDAARYRGIWTRNAEAWRGHLEACRAFILRSARSAAGHGVAVVAGSGWCLDVPLEELSRLFVNVVLVDVAHPLEVRRRAARLGNVRLLHADLTGSLSAVLESLKSGVRLPNRFVPVDPLPGVSPDITISANALARLPLLPMERLWTAGRHSEGELEAFARNAMQAHLDWLESRPGVRCLLTELAWLGVADNETMMSDPLHGVASPAPQERWEWSYAPRPEAHPLRDVVHVIGATVF
ncbi:hypothetical protein NNJEOMEG_01755 [Fundidesulfovibrio magnetotacticus]|uniref:Class I SAM-dependent methyltransferase n=1 Tax=Fundidesulfovibrio magnetotacticus TaxID=2730080 RepID=A0A6V8LW79_9BACT|nr:hypothetical protein [Fundidesulfovibrio magnetotacticus]GFK93917.1 hypothetical protein NNJEOMEG_01755 [Fundidesulfovibrio magnetotacticus]